MALTCEARDYVAEQEPRERETLPPELQLLASCEALRLTARLTQVMAWLLMQRAVHAGEIDRETARGPQHRLGGQEVCLAAACPDENLPLRLRDLLARSAELYDRIARLDAALDD